MAQCEYITNKYGMHFEFDKDPSHYIPKADPDEESTETETVGAIEALTALEQESEE